MNQNLQHFIGKMCTVFTLPINRNFKDENPKTFVEQSYFYFLGVIEAVDNEGILVTQHETGLKSYFFKQNIVGIAEEEILNPENEKDAKIIEKMIESNDKLNEKIKKYETQAKEVINPDELMSMLKNIKGK
jgi:hypothetical protein